MSEKEKIVECIRCPWFGSWDDLKEGDDGFVCPTCQSIDSFVEREDDGVSDDDYREQNPIERPSE